MQRKNLSPSWARHSQCGIRLYGDVRNAGYIATWLELFAGGFVEIDTNVQLEELLESTDTHAFETLMHNSDSLKINGVEIAKESILDILNWYARVCEMRRQGSITPLHTRNGKQCCM